MGDNAHRDEFMNKLVMHVYDNSPGQVVVSYNTSAWLAEPDMMGS